MKKVLRFRVVASGVFLLCVVTAIAASGQTLNTLATFDSTNGAIPGVGGPLVQGFDGNFYGTSAGGGAYGGGNVFKVTAGGTLTTLYDFCAQQSCVDGKYPQAQLAQGTDGNLYGTTYEGGVSYTYGTVFKITPQGTLTTLHSFDLSDGAYPLGVLIQASDGNFYGTTSGGGGNNGGSIFKITPEGTLTTVYSFCAKANCTDGSGPSAGLIRATDGDFYGTTYQGGTYGYGTVFRVSTTGILATLYSFCAQGGYCADGSAPLARLVQGRDGNFYGTTRFGGYGYTYGTVFKITAMGTLTTLHSFDLSDGYEPFAGLLQATDGNLYGTTRYDGAYGYGTLFEITVQGGLATLYNFCSQTGCNDGANPVSDLTQSTSGTFYSATAGGGGSSACTWQTGCGTVFSFSVGLAPFVETLPTVGKVGSKVIILGNNLTGATSVTFNGTPATFTVVSPAEIKTTVPTGATSGKLQVTTPKHTLTSNVVFQVK